MELESVIGLEVHVQLKTKSKMFSPASNADDGEPNTHIDPVVAGHPGALPVPNKQAVWWAQLAGLALGCTLAKNSKFDRKNYFYPDLPKGYQISQFDQPFAKHGRLKVLVGDDTKTIRVGRLHLEEDAGKLTHVGGYSLVDYNRAGTPLVEIVTEPDMRSPQEAVAFMKALQKILRYLGVSDADMEKGHMRADASISLRPVGDDTLYPRSEIKNLNSFKAVENALTYDIERQRALWQEDKAPDKESTLTWNDAKGETVFLRNKEGAADYRYFPEPDIPPMEFDDAYLAALKAMLPELPAAKKQRFMDEYAMPAADAETMTDTKALADFFEHTVSELAAWHETEEGAQQKTKATTLVKNYILTELLKHLNATGDKISAIKVTPENMAELIKLIANGDIGSSAAQEVFKEMYKSGDDPSHIVDEKGLRQVSDAGALEGIVEKVMQTNQEVAEEYRQGKENALQFLVGQVMKETKGQANPKVAADVLKTKLSRIS